MLYNLKKLKADNAPRVEFGRCLLNTEYVVTLNNAICKKSFLDRFLKSKGKEFLSFTTPVAYFWATGLL